MAELSSGAVVSVVNPSAVIEVSAPGLVKSLWLKEGPPGAPGADGEVTTAAMVAYAQPLDSDLTAIAALSTTSYGRALLALADQAALTASLAAATESLPGSIEIATQAETNTGTDDARAVTPLKLQTRLAAYAQPLDSDLTAIAALTTTTYGRAFLALADAAAARTALALGTAATVNTGTTSGTIPTLGASGTLAVARLATGTPDGTKFVADDGTLKAPSGGGGSGLLASTAYNPTTVTNVTNSTTTFIDVDATNLVLPTFTIPASGAVIFILTARVMSANGSNPARWGIGVGGTVVAESAARVSVATSATAARIVHRVKITGLTPGATSSAYRWMHASSAATVVTTTTYGGTGTTAEGQALMEVWAV